MILTSRVPPRNGLARINRNVNHIIKDDGPIFVGRSSRVRRQNRGALDDSSIIFENLSMVFHQENNKSRRSSMNGDDADSLSKYDFSLGAPSYLDQKSFRSGIQRLDSNDSMGVAFRGASRIARGNISQYKFEHSVHKIIDEEADDDDDTGSSSSEDRGQPGHDDISFGSFREKVEEQKHTLSIADDKKLLMLVGAKGKHTHRDVSASVTSKPSPSSKPKKDNGKMKSFFAWLFHHRPKHAISKESQETETMKNSSLQEHSIRRSQLTKTASEMRRASF